MVIGKLGEDNMKVTEQDELVLILNLFGLLREFEFKLERHSMGSE